ncbi:hypothetical protein SCHPADRAFT_906113 [Schizopora paradoxa]|uniref:Uncharacterized protein n=1 Tax=Schizopora paradoxa TaxID=27342 RepID=A0A0H2S2U1_9AGAM|nr:hypothetical protein SCHPADRAFT_906113 [Schizopora paradoxa]
MSSSSSTHLLAVAPEDLLYACVAYTRNEMLEFDTIIAEHSSGALISTLPAPRKSLVDLPAELLLTVRHHLQASLTARTRSEAAYELATYEDTLLDGLCADCFWWNFDMHGPDVWEWVKNGYKERCQCNGGASVTPAAAETLRTRTAEASRKHPAGASTSTPRPAPVPSPSKRQWLDAFVEREYRAGGAWTELVPSVLASLSCEISGVAAASHSAEESSAYMRDADTQFGPAVLISGDDVALGRVTRELGLAPTTCTSNLVDDEYRKRCTMQYAHHLLAQQPRAQQADYFQIHGHISCSCSSCSTLAANSSSSASQLVSSVSSRNADVIAFLGAVDVSIRHASTLLSFAFVSSLLCLTSMIAPRSWNTLRTEQRS